MEDEDDVEQHLNPFSEHQEERCQEEVVEQNGGSLAPVLQQCTHTHIHPVSARSAFTGLQSLAVASSVLELPGNGGDFSPTAVVDPHVIHGVEVSTLSAPRCRPPILLSKFDHCGSLLLVRNCIKCYNQALIDSYSIIY